jgi:hypothetical protein
MGLHKVLFPIDTTREAEMKLCFPCFTALSLPKKKRNKILKHAVKSLLKPIYHLEQTSGTQNKINDEEHYYDFFLNKGMCIAVRIYPRFVRITEQVIDLLITNYCE